MPVVFCWGRRACESARKDRVSGLSLIDRQARHGDAPMSKKLTRRSKTESAAHRREREAKAAGNPASNRRVRGSLRDHHSLGCRKRGCWLCKAEKLKGEKRARDMRRELPGEA